MAQDFYSVFNVGTDERHIAPIDENGMALPAIQGLNQKLNQKNAEIQNLKARLEKLINAQNEGRAMKTNSDTKNVERKTKHPLPSHRLPWRLSSFFIPIWHLMNPTKWHYQQKTP